jgi:predicted CXXCH cytochrome family protein
MRTLKLALAAVAAFAFNANAQTPVTGMTQPPTGFYQPVVVANSGATDNFGFHAGGVAACDGCHVMHNATNGVAKSTTGLSGEPAWNSFTNAYLLQGGDQSSTCLICHGSNEARVAGTSPQFIVADLRAGQTPSYRTPGGDFGWINVDFGAALGGGIASPGEAHGHNVAARDFGWQVDGRYTSGIAPGGSFTFDGVTATEKFACSSCHDPHGRYRMQAGAGGTNGVVFAGPYAGSPPTQPIIASGSYGTAPDGTYAVGSYRLLAGQRYAPASKPGFPFPNNPPVAVAPQTYNQSEGNYNGAGGNEVRVNYATGMSEWCQNCHASIHLNGYSSGWSGLRHPAGSGATLHAGQFNLYNTYVSSGVIDSNLTSSYTSLVPFEQGTSIDLATLRAQAAAGTSIVAGPTTNVMCLSCHRAHASAFDSMVRWDQNATFLTDGTTFTGGATDRLADVTAAGYYDRDVGSAAGSGGETLGTYQRSLCNKCHGKD